MIHPSLTGGPLKVVSSTFAMVIEHCLHCACLQDTRHQKFELCVLFLPDTPFFIPPNTKATFMFEKLLRRMKEIDMFMNT